MRSNHRQITTKYHAGNTTLNDSIRKNLLITMLC